jgi:hypothetical protein
MSTSYTHSPYKINVFGPDFESQSLDDDIPAPRVYQTSRTSSSSMNNPQRFLSALRLDPWADIEGAVGKLAANHLKLIARTKEIPICSSPDTIPLSDEIKSLAIQVSQSSFSVFSSNIAFRSYREQINEKTREFLKEAPQKALDCLEPDYHERIKQSSKVAEYIREIRCHGTYQRFDLAREAYTEALVEGAIDDKTFGTYLCTLIKRKSKAKGLKKTSIQNEAVRVYITALRLNFRSDAIDKLFNELFIDESPI